MMKVGIVGTGAVGPSIAQVFAQCGEVEIVYLCKGRECSIRNGKDALEQNLMQLVSKGKMPNEQMTMILNKIKIGSKQILADADLIVEAVAENIEVKRLVFHELDQICKKECIFTTNTSSLPIDMIGEGVTREVAGLHFFNPVPVMKLVEVIGSEKTSQHTLSILMEIARKIGKTPVEVHKSPGFIVNRLLIPMINEAIGIYAEGAASAENIDMAMKLGANHPMGPLALGDLIGLDVVLAILEEMLQETGNAKYCPEKMLRQMVNDGKLGRKTGEGFYEY